MTTILTPEGAAAADLGETWEEAARSRARGTKDFDPSLHPRDAEGQFAETAGELSDQEKATVSRYVADGYLNFNTWLRTGTVPRGEWKTVHTMDAAIERSTITRDMTVYRGIKVIADPRNRRGYDQTVKQAMPPGATVSDKAFMSTSASAKVARGFAGSPGTLVAISVPAGINGLVVGDLSDTPSEEEVILPRSTKIEIDRYETHGVGGKPTVYAHVVG